MKIDLGVFSVSAKVNKKYTLGEKLKLMRLSAEDTTKHKRRFNTTLKHVFNARLREDFCLAMRRLREDTVICINNERAPPRRRLDEKFIAIDKAEAKTIERKLDPVVVSVWNEYKEWGLSQGLKLKAVLEKDDEHVFEWYAMFFDVIEEKKK